MYKNFMYLSKLGKSKSNLVQMQSNLGKNREINKQSHVKFWFNRKKYGAVSYFCSGTPNSTRLKRLSVPQAVR